MSEWGLTAAGFTAPREADFLTLIRDRFEADTGKSFDWSRDTFLAWCSENMAKQLDLLAEALQAVYDARAPSNATGVQLDHLCLIVGVTRNEATKSTCLVTLTGTAGTIITTGKQVGGGGSDGKARWKLTEDVTIPAGGSTTTTVECTVAGETEAEVGGIDTIVTPVSGWTAVSGPAVVATDLAVGRDRETDSELRARRQRSLARGGSSSVASIRAALLELDYVESAVVVENDTGATATVSGLSLAAKSVGAVLYPSTLTDAQKSEVAETIYAYVAAGIYTNGSTSATVTGGDGSTKTIRWTWASTTTVNVANVVTLKPGYVLDDVEEPLQEAIADYFLALGPGDTVSMLELYAIVASIPGIKTTALTLNGVAADVTTNANTAPVLGTNTVTE